MQQRYNQSRENQQVDRTAMNYDSANLSEEESSTLINILDRKKYNQLMAANKSAEDNFQPR